MIAYKRGCRAIAQLDLVAIGMSSIPKQSLSFRLSFTNFLCYALPMKLVGWLTAQSCTAVVRQQVTYKTFPVEHENI